MTESRDRYYCPDCWDKIDAPAPPRCNRAASHHPASAVKIGIVIEHADGSKTYIASDQFDSIDLDFRRHPQYPWSIDYLFQIPPIQHTTIVITIGGVRNYKMVKGQVPLPGLEDGNIVDLGER